MNMSQWMAAIVLFLLSVMLQSNFVHGKKDLGLYCGACKAIIDEIEYEISKVDPRKKIDVGSFRVDPNGKTKSVKVAYARSEVYLSEQLEEVCSKMNTYAESISDDGKRKFVRTSSRDGEALSLENVSMSRDTTKQLKFACESIIEEHEDEFIKYISNSDKDVVYKICSEVGEYCMEEDDDESPAKEEL